MTATKDYNDGLTTAQRLAKQHFQIMNHDDFCLYSGIISMGTVEVCDDVPTAGTDGRNVYYGDKFVRSLTDPELRFLILHETLHKALRHLTTWRALHDEDPNLANAACDYVINLMLKDADKGETFIKMPASGLVDERFRGMDAGRVFRELKKDQEEEPCDGDKKGQGQGQQSKGAPQPMDSHDWDKANQLTEEEAQKLADEIDTALRQGAMLVGRKKGNVPRDITEILKPKVDWKGVLREFVKSTIKGCDDTTWSKLDRRRLSQRIYLPSHISNSVRRIVCAPDVSGSVSPELLNQFISEVKSVVDEVSPEYLDVLYWDASVQKHEAYDRTTGQTYTQVTKTTGGGGTDPDVVPAYMGSEDNAKDFDGLQCVVMLTDGYVPGWGDWSGVTDDEGAPVPVLWVICGDKRAVPTYGQVVWVE